MVQALGLQTKCLALGRFRPLMRDWILTTSSLLQFLAGTRRKDCEMPQLAVRTGIRIGLKATLSPISSKIKEVFGFLIL